MWGEFYSSTNVLAAGSSLLPHKQQQACEGSAGGQRHLGGGGDSFTGSTERWAVPAEGAQPVREALPLSDWGFL